MAYARQKGSNHLEVLFAQNGVSPLDCLMEKLKQNQITHTQYL